MVTSAKINASKTRDTAIAKNNASDPILDSLDPDINTNTTTAANNSAASTTHIIKNSSSVSGSSSNSNSNKNDNNITTTSNGNSNNTNTNDTRTKAIDDDDINNDSDVGNNEVIENKEKGENMNKNCSNTCDVAAIVVTTDVVTPNNVTLLPKPSPPPQVIIIPARTTATNPPSNVATNAAKKIRRAFSMPRNPFRWTHKTKTSAGGGSTHNTNCTTAQHKTGKAQDSGGGSGGGGGGTKGGGGSGSGMNFSAISKSYTLSSCVGGKRERAESFVSLNSNDDGADDDGNGNGNGTYANANKTHNNTYSTSNNSISKRDTQSQSCMMPPSKKQQQEGGEEKQECKDFLNKSSNKKLTTKSNTIHGVSSLSSNVSSTTLPNGGSGGGGGVGGASLSSTMPAGTSNINNSNNNNNNNRLFRRSSFRKFLNRIAQHVTASTNKQNTTTTATATGATATNGHTISTTADRVPPISGYQWPNDQTPGVMGLKNHGNTCFMNAVLQCLSHTDILAEYFVLDQYKADLKRRNKINSRKFGTKGELTEQLANVLKALWTCKNESDHSTSFKAVVDRYGSQFRSSTQHDAQEFLFWLLDKVHEDLNTATKRRYKSVKNNYGRPDEVIAAETLANHIRCNNSFVQAVFQAQFRSSLTCPRCKKQSNTFDPFHCISVQLPQLTQQTIFVTVVYLTQQPRQVRMGVTVTAGSPIMALREQLHKDTGIANEQMVLVDLQREGFMRVFYDTQPVNSLQGIETIYCIEVPLEKDAKKDAQTNVNSPQSADLLVLVANVKKTKLEDKNSLERFGAPFCLQIPRDCSYSELQKKLLKEMSVLLKPEVFSYNTPLSEMFQIRLQDPSADPDTFIEQVEHPLLTEMIDLALSVLSTEAGPMHIKLLLEWPEPEKHFCDLTDHVVEHESVPRLLANKSNDTAALTLEQCLEHYTKAETLSAEDAWRCPHCQEYLPVVKTLGLWSLPDILVVHFKRFRQHHGKGANAAKLTTMVKFPLHSFDMSPHLARGVNEINSTATNNAAGGGGSSFNRPSPWRKSRPGDSRSSTLSSRDNRETRYDLYAVCYHQGDTLETGHYTAACKNPYDRQWYKFDDQRVAKVCSDALPDEIVNNEAYMLFYQRRTSENAECSGSSSNSSDHWVSRIAPAQVTAAVTSTTAIHTNNVEKIVKSEVVVNEKSTASESLEPEVKKTDSKEIHKIIQEKEIPAEAKIAQPEKETPSSTPPANSATTTINAQINTVESNLDAFEKLLDYADADIDVITEETDVAEKFEKLEVKENKMYTKENLTSKEDFHLLEQSKDSVDNIVETRPAASTLTSLSNGFENKVKNSIPITNGHTNNKIIKLKTPTSSASSSLSSLSSQSHESSSLAVSKNAANNLQNKFNGFLQSHAVDEATTTGQSNEKEHLLSSSLKSNSSCIIGSALVGHFSTYRQTPWHGSRSSVSAVEPSSASGAQQSSLHLRHSFSTASNYRLRECGDTLSSVLRNSVNTCSKDTLIFLDQQQHHHHGSHRHHNHHHGLMEDDDDSTFMGSRSLWISPVTPHKLITVSPKN